jgi:dimethylamine monooxygenase subunit B
MIQSSPLRLKVRKIEILSPTLRRITLGSINGVALPTALPGAHLSLSLPNGTRTLQKSYSIVSSPEVRQYYQVIVRRTETSRGGSAYIHDKLTEGDCLDSAPPNSLLPLQNKARKHLLISGGIGITPMLSFLPVLSARHARFEMHQFAKPSEVSLFRQILAPFASHNVHVHSGRAARSLSDVLSGQPLGTHIYCCGPLRLMDGVEQTAQSLGWPPSRIHRESFGAQGGSAFSAHLIKSGLNIEVGEHESLLEAIERVGVTIGSLCRGGACGECRTRVISGEPEHRDHFLTREERAEGQSIMPCVSRAQPCVSRDQSTTLVLDI